MYAIPKKVKRTAACPFLCINNIIDPRGQTPFWRCFFSFYGPYVQDDLTTSPSFRTAAWRGVGDVVLRGHVLDVDGGLLHELAQLQVQGFSQIWATHYDRAAKTHFLLQYLKSMDVFLHYNSRRGSRTVKLDALILIPFSMLQPIIMLLSLPMTT